MEFSNQVFINFKNFFSDTTFLKQNIFYDLNDAEYDINNKIFQKLITSISFEKNFKNIIQSKNFSSKKIFDLTNELISTFSQKNITDSWLNYIFNYTLSLSFPNSVEIEINHEYDRSCNIFLYILNFFCEVEKFTPSFKTWQSKFPLILMDFDEFKDEDDSDEYLKFKEAFDNQFIYCLMKLSQDLTPYNNLDHICGVHFLSMFLARQLKNIKINISLCRVSGAGAGHDIGKYGCKKNELPRVPYLHYFYTDQWFEQQDINYIKSIAINHSVWDLELENLSLESLVLIYSDFRVKNKQFEDNKLKMHIFSLDESFEVILDKLDNLDEAKTKRYKKVYDKLKDFENFMIRIGVDVNLESNLSNSNPIYKNHYSLIRNSETIVNVFKDLAINHNIELMYIFRNEMSLNHILELARSEKNSDNLREYMELLEEYCTYLTKKQKSIVLKFLYEKLTHSEDDIRNHSSFIIGKVIANYDEEYKKEVPKDIILKVSLAHSIEILDRFIYMYLFPDKKLISIHRNWIRNGLSIMLESLFFHCKKTQAKSYISILIPYFKDLNLNSINSQIYLLKSIFSIPLNEHIEFFSSIEHFLLKNLESQDENLRIYAYLVLNWIMKLDIDKQFFKNFLSISKSKLNVENIYELWLLNQIKYNDSNSKSNSLKLIDSKNISKLFINDFKNNYAWVSKLINIDILLNYSLKNISSYGLYTAIHFCNMIKSSPNENVRDKAGLSLVTLFKKLPNEQANEVAIELFRSLEVEEYQFTKYIPNYLGKILLDLNPSYLDNIIEILSEKLKRSGSKVSSLILKTIGICIANYFEYSLRFKEDNNTLNSRLLKMIGILLSGLSHNENRVRQTSFRVIGKEIFGNESISFTHRKTLFTTMCKKILTLIYEIPSDKLLFMNNSYVLNNLYRFISNYIFINKKIEIDFPKKIAFFPGTFDPFSLSHKEIAKSIRDLGFEVYLSVDEFSWSKRTQANFIRRNIINMSISDELNIYLFPEDLPININNNKDLTILKNIFNETSFFIAVGSDVVLNASAYKNYFDSNSVCSMNHIIFERCKLFDSKDSKAILKNFEKKIKGEIINLILPEIYEDISSSQIRSYIDENRDISKLVDPICQKYIYSNNLYKKEPIDKSMVQQLSIDIEVLDTLQDDLLENLLMNFHNNYKDTLKRINNLIKNPNIKILILKDRTQNNKIIAYSIFEWLPSEKIYSEIKDSKLSEIIRKNYMGRIILIDGIFVHPSFKKMNLHQILLTETLAYCISKDYGYCLYLNRIDEKKDYKVFEILELQGFQKFETIEGKILFHVNMNNPCSLYLDLKSLLKNPFRNNPEVVKTINNCRKKLQKSLTMLFPGNLVLAFDRRILEQMLMKKVCKENEVPSTPLNSKKLGDDICVSYGNILNRLIIPNTVTKSLHTEKIFSTDLKDFSIEEFPNYLNLKNQIKTLKSFNKSIILIDDLLNKGYRIKALDPILNKENIDVKKIIVGILSGRGKELMEIQNRLIDYAYFIPNLNLWFTEQLLYPFMGGDSIINSNKNSTNLISSINLILPYAYPQFIKNANYESIFHLSKTCLENSLEILQILELIYENLNERNLTLENLGEVFITPRIPYLGDDISYDTNKLTSTYIKAHLELLKRLKGESNEFLSN